MNLVPAHGLLSFLPLFSDGVYLYRQPSSGRSRLNKSGRAILSTDGVYRRESTGTGPEVLKVVRVTGVVYSGNPMNQIMCAPLFPRSLQALQLTLGPDRTLHLVLLYQKRQN